MVRKPALRQRQHVQIKLVQQLLEHELLTVAKRPVRTPAANDRTRVAAEVPQRLGVVGPDRLGGPLHAGWIRVDPTKDVEHDVPLVPPRPRVIAADRRGDVQADFVSSRRVQADEHEIAARSQGLRNAIEKWRIFDLAPQRVAVLAAEAEDGALLVVAECDRHS